MLSSPLNRSFPSAPPRLPIAADRGMRVRFADERRAFVLGTFDKAFAALGIVASGRYRPGSEGCSSDGEVVVDDAAGAVASSDDTDGDDGSDVDRASGCRGGERTVGGVRDGLLRRLLAQSEARAALAVALCHAVGPGRTVSDVSVVEFADAVAGVCDWCALSGVG